MSPKEAILFCPLKGDQILHTKALAKARVAKIRDDDEPHIDALSIVYHLSRINPPPPIATINAIGISGDSAISMAAMVDVITVHEHRLPSAMMTKISDVSPITSSLLILVDNTANTRLSLASIHPMEAVIAAIAVADGGLAVLPQFLSTICILVTSVCW